MKINEVRQNKLEFISFLWRLSQNPLMEFDALSRGVDHVVIRVGRNEQQANEKSSPSLHVVTDASVYRECLNLPRADYLRNALIEEDGVVGLLATPHAEHQAGKADIMSYFRRSKVANSLAIMSETIDAALGQWQREGHVSPFAAARTITTQYFLRYAFGVIPSEQDCTAIARSSLVSTEVKLRLATDPRHFSCLRPLLEQHAVEPFISKDEREILDTKKRWIGNLTAQRIERDKNKIFFREPDDLLDVIVRQAMVFQGGKPEGTFGAQIEALGKDGWHRARKQAAKYISALITAATETTSTLIAYAMYTVAYDRGLQESLRYELAECGRELCAGRAPNVRALLDKNKAPVLQEVISDSLRRYPPFHFSFPRQIPHDIKIGELDFQTGDIVVFDFSRLQRPFHAGEYVCLGKTVAELEATVILAKIFGTLRVEPYAGMATPEPKRSSIISTPSVDVPLRVYGF